MAENIWEVAWMLPENERGMKTVSRFLHKLSYSHFATKAASCTDIAECTHHPDSVAPDAPDSLTFPIPVATPVSTADSIVPVTPITPSPSTVIGMPIVINPVQEKEVDKVQGLPPDYPTKQLTMGQSASHQPGRVRLNRVDGDTPAIMMNLYDPTNSKQLGNITVPVPACFSFQT